MAATAAIHVLHSIPAFPVVTEATPLARRQWILSVMKDEGVQSPPSVMAAQAAIHDN
jgi:hypothetical protein